ncbi:hypothetical protein [Geminocystis sp. GBBB08]|uniref:hypothetical protein n=1 Tax=Geminocystis sp. GBBB08 TaxID=2604140 RepID=UPI0027E2A888|nr:hypothetical protein [Geminocystis sp. GBBB08]MBL1208261.1 hypothetical protein [Geminocystis sp. GBBB08]
MILPPKIKRDNLNIDTYQRGIAWSALLLRNAYKNSDIKDTVQLAVNATPAIANLVVRVTIEYTDTSLITNANILDNIVEKLVGITEYIETISSPSTLPNITNEPLVVQSLEQYFYWCSQQYLALDTTKANVVKITPVFNQQSKNLIDCLITLPIKYEVYLTTNNIIQAIDAVADDDISIPISIFGNTLLVGNNNLIGN